MQAVDRDQQHVPDRAVAVVVAVAVVMAGAAAVVVAAGMGGTGRDGHGNRRQAATAMPPANLERLDNARLPSVKGVGVAVFYGRADATGVTAGVPR